MLNAIWAKVRGQLLRLRPAKRVETMLSNSYLVHRGTLAGGPDYDGAWMLACANHAEVVLDVGANIGKSAFLFLQSPTVRELVLIDANPLALSMAADNLITNHLSMKLRFVTAFVSETDDDTVTFWTVGVGSAGSMYQSHSKTAAHRAASISTTSITLDTLCHTFQLTPDLVKIDVEGAEAKALRGGRTLAQRGQTRFFVEMHSNSDLPMEVNAKAVIEWCAEVGYSAWYLKKHQLLTQPDLISSRGRCHLLLQPKSWDYPDWLVSIKQGDSLDKALS